MPTTSGNSQVAISYRQWRGTVVFPGVRLHTEKNQIEDKPSTISHWIRDYVGSGLKTSEGILVVILR